MKYAYTILFVLMASFGFSQDLTWADVGDTIRMAPVGTDIEFHSEYQNSSMSPIDVRWRIIDFSPSSGNWEAYLCEEVICWPDYPGKSWSDVVVPANGTFQMYQHVEMLTDSGSAYITLCSHDLSDSAGTYECKTYFALTDTAVAGPIDTTDTTVTDTTNSIAKIQAEQFQLKQNAPNPFRESTEIRYEIASENGMIRIHDLTGKMVEEVALTSRSGAVTVGNELRSGVYFYSLWDNGIMKATKRMQVIE